MEAPGAWLLEPRVAETRLCAVKPNPRQLHTAADHDSSGAKEGVVSRGAGLLRGRGHVPQRVSGHVPWRVSGHVPRRVSEHIPRRVSEHVPWRVSGHVPRRVHLQETGLCRRGNYK